MNADILDSQFTTWQSELAHAISQKYNELGPKPGQGIRLKDEAGKWAARSSIRYLFVVGRAFYVGATKATAKQFKEVMPRDLLTLLRHLEAGNYEVVSK